MEKPDLEQVQKLAKQLSAQERFELFDYLSKLPDSLIKPLPEPKPVPPLSEEQKKSLQQVNVRWESKRDDEGRIVYSLNGKEIFTASFNEENYAEVFYEELKSDKVFLRISDEQRAHCFEEVRKRLAEAGITPTDAELREIEPQALLVLGQQLLKKVFFTQQVGSPNICRR